MARRNDTPRTADKERYTLSEWREEAVRRFGRDSNDWAFVCPVCGHRTTVADWARVGAGPGEVAFSCIGRHVEGAKAAFDEKGEGPCTYAGGGLFRLNPLVVVDPEGHEHQVFDFAPPVLHRCASPACPGYPWKASDSPHPCPPGGEG